MKRQKYGYIYRTHLFGNPTVRVTGASNVRHVLLGEHRLVAAQWPASVRTILGSGTLSNVHGAQHKMKKRVRGIFFFFLHMTSGDDVIITFPAITSSLFQLRLHIEVIFSLDLFFFLSL